MLFYTIGLVLFILFILANFKYYDRPLREEKCIGITIDKFLILRYGKKNRQNEKRGIITLNRLFIISISVIIFLIIANESIKSNGDLRGYYNRYNILSNMNFDYFKQNWSDMKDPFYHLCGFIASKLGLSFYGWHTIIALVVALAVYNLVNKYSTNVFISFIVVFVLGILGFALSGLRQTLALAVLMFSFTYIREKKLLRFILIVLFASLFHSTALIFITAYPVYQIKFNVKNLILIFLGGVGILLFANRIVGLYMRLAGTDEIYASYLTAENGLSISGVIISGFILIFCLVCMLMEKENVKNGQICYLLLISFFTNILSVLWFAEFFRISMFFSLFECIAIAEACTCSKKNVRFTQLKTFGVSLALFAYYFVSQNGNIINYVAR